jgi:peptidyl-prolyl cis-trans isomerase A (cyclophilin A)
MAHDVFVSYSAKNKTTADAVCAMLESQGIRCWIAPRDVVPGAEYGESISDAIEQARIMVLVFTADANASPQVRREVERAASQDVAILPLRLEDVLPAKALAFFIGNVHWLDALTPPLETHLKKLAGTINARLDSAASHKGPLMEPPPRQAPHNAKLAEPAVHRPATQRPAIADSKIYAVFTTTGGKFTARLFTADAPVTVKNFIELAEGRREWTHPVTRAKSSKKLYDGTIFHRVQPGFFIEGGDPAGTGWGEAGTGRGELDPFLADRARIKDETENSPHKFDRPGMLARYGAYYDTNGSQFIIVLGPAPFLDGKHTIFGEVVEGLETVVKISNVRTDPRLMPRKPVVLESVVIQRGA